MIRAGLLDEVCDVVRYEKSTDKFGADTGQWTVVAEGVPCQVSHKQSGFGELNGEVVYQHVTTFVFRYTDALREYDRLRWDGRTYQIEGIDRSRRLWGEMPVTCSLIGMTDEVP